MDPDESPNTEIVYTTTQVSGGFCLYRLTAGRAAPDYTLFFNSISTSGVNSVCRDGYNMILAGLLAEGAISVARSDSEIFLESGDSLWLVYNRYAYNMYNEIA